MGAISWSLLTLILFSCDTAIGQMNCQRFSPVPATVSDSKTDFGAAIDLFKGAFLGSTKVPPVSASAQYKSRDAQIEVLSKFPNADVLALRQQELYYVCQLLNSDSKMGTKEKLDYLHRVSSGLTVSATIRTKASAKARASNDSNSHIPIVSSPITQSCPNGICINGSGTINNPTVINNGPPPLSVSCGQTEEEAMNEGGIQSYRRIVVCTPNVRWEPVALVINASRALLSEKVLRPTYQMMVRDHLVGSQAFIDFQQPAVQAGSPLAVEVRSADHFVIFKAEPANPSDP